MSAPCETLCKEKRIHPRYELSWPIRLHDTPHGDHDTNATDISLGGIAIHCTLCADGEPAAGQLPESCPLRCFSSTAETPSPLVVTLHLPGNGIVQTTVQVVHAQGEGGAEGHRIGAAFLQMSCSDFDRLSSALVAAAAEETGS